MHSSMSLNSTKDKAQPKMTNFHKDIIIPSIYSSENYQIMKNFSHPVRPQRKVIQAKQARVQSIVQNIVCKKVVQVSNKKPHYNHRLAKPIYHSKRKSLPTFVYHKPQTLTMDIDERLNQKALMYEQQSTVAQQKLKQIMDKIKQVGIIKQNDGEQINFYLTQLSPKKKVKSRPTSRPPSNMYISTTYTPKKVIKGYVQENQQREIKRQLRNKIQVNTQPQLKVKQVNRPKTTDSQSTKKRNTNIFSSQHEYDSTQILFRSNSLMNTRLNRFEQRRQLKQNIKLSQKNRDQKQKLKNLFDKIQLNHLQNTLGRGELVSSLNKLGLVWKDQKQFLQSKPNRVVMQLSNQTLSLLISKRKKTGPLNQVDQKYINQEQNLLSSKDKQTL